MTVLAQLAALVEATAPGRRALVAVDGVDGSGKTTLADALAATLSRPVERACVDDFLRADRYRRGRDSAEGCYRDSHDHPALRRKLLASRAAAGQAVLVVDGVFLLRPELDVPWDLTVHLQVPDDEVLRRVLLRDGADVGPRYRARYLPAQRLYEAEGRPAGRADVLLDNSNPRSPVVLRWPGKDEGEGYSHGVAPGTRT